MEDKINDKENENKISSENEGQNIINDPEEINKKQKESSLASKDNLNDDIWKGNSKYKIKYTHIIEYIKSQDKKDNDSQNENQFLCNILFIPENIEVSNKIAILNLLSSYYRNRDFLYNIANKLDKCFDSFNAIDPIFPVNIYVKVIQYLNSKNLYIYSYKYMLIIQKIIKKNKVIIEKKYNIKPIQNLFEEIKINYTNYINNNQLKFSDDLSIKDETIQEIKNLIDLLMSEKYNIDNNIDSSKDNSNFIYIINKDWIFKTKLFIENIITARKQKIKNFFEEAFDPNFVYDSYFNETNETTKDNNEKIKKSSKLFCAFPGPVNNFEITSFKDSWIDFINLDENDFLKKGKNYIEHYFYVNEKDWRLIKSLFGVTNDIKRKKNNLDLIAIKYIIFDDRFNSNNNNMNLLKQKYILINKNSTIKQLKEKIMNVTNQNLKNVQMDENEKEILKKYKICFYVLEKEKRNILIEMMFSFYIGNEKYDSLFIEKLEFNDENTLKDFFNKYNKEKHILIVEYSNEPYFFIDLKKEMIGEYKCTVCGTKIKSLKDKYNCEICNLSLFCSSKCANKSKEHINLDKQSLKIYEKKFILSDLLSLDLESLLTEDNNKGRVGLYNMGNTCYFNSALQCLSNTEDLTKYFLKQYFKTEINNANSLGSKGFISGEYYKLIKTMWTKRINCFLPKEFRINFCRKTDLFCNNEQQDSQEFLLAVLDNLHEDLNRITNKKYMELQEQQNGESDEEASKRWWDYYRSRDNSIIVDLFQGQYKSTIKCCTCNKASISYDTFLNLGLPIPSKNTQNQIKFLTADLKCIEINYCINENVKLKDIKNKAIFLSSQYLRNNNLKEKENKIDEKTKKELYNNIEVIEFRKKYKMANIYKTSFDQASLSDILKNNKNSEIVLFEKETNKDPQNYTYIYVYPMTEKEIKGYFSANIQKVLLSYPIILTVKKDNTLEDLQKIIDAKIKDIIIPKKEEDTLNSIEICFPHFTKGWGNFSNQKGECPICDKKYEKEKKKFCNLKKKCDKNISVSDLMNYLPGKPLILFAKIQSYNSDKEIYAGIPLFNEKSKINEKPNINLYDSFNLFGKEDSLDSDNMWYCNNCKKHQNAKKKIEIYRTPIYLIIQLKRFKHRNNIMRYIIGNKNETYVEYKENINLKDFIVGPDKTNSIYNLYGVIIHSKFMNGGHYYAYCKNGGKWITYDDESLRACNNPIDKDAYLLFYKRIKFD